VACKGRDDPQRYGLAQSWLRNIAMYTGCTKKSWTYHRSKARYDRLVELNVYEQCRNVVKTAAVQQQYLKHKYPEVHGWTFTCTTPVA